MSWRIVLGVQIRHVLDLTRVGELLELRGIDRNDVRKVAGGQHHVHLLQIRCESVVAFDDPIVFDLDAELVVIETGPAVILELLVLQHAEDVVLDDVAQVANGRDTRSAGRICRRALPPFPLSRPHCRPCLHSYRCRRRPPAPPRASWPKPKTNSERILPLFMAIPSSSALPLQWLRTLSLYRLVRTDRTTFIHDLALFQCKRSQARTARTRICKIQCLYAIRNDEIRRIFLPYIREVNRYRSESRTVP